MGPRARLEGWREPLRGRPKGLQGGRPERPGLLFLKPPPPPQFPPDPKSLLLERPRNRSLRHLRGPEPPTRRLQPILSPKPPQTAAARAEERRRGRGDRSAAEEAIENPLVSAATRIKISSTCLGSSYLEFTVSLRSSGPHAPTACGVRLEFGEICFFTTRKYKTTNHKRAPPRCTAPDTRTARARRAAIVARRSPIADWPLAVGLGLVRSFGRGRG